MKPLETELGLTQCYLYHILLVKCGLSLGFPGGSVVKNPPAMQETWVQSLGCEDPLEEGMATNSNILAWKIPWTEGFGGLQRVGHDWCDWALAIFGKPWSQVKFEGVPWWEELQSHIAKGHRYREGKNSGPSGKQHATVPFFSILLWNNSLQLREVYLLLHLKLCFPISPFSSSPFGTSIRQTLTHLYLVSIPHNFSYLSSLSLYSSLNSPK